MKIRSLAIAAVIALPLTLALGRSASAHESGYDHRDGNVYHQYLPDGTHVDHEYGRHGRHVDHEYDPDGTHIDHVYGRHGEHVDHEYLPDGEHIDHDYTGGGHRDYYRRPGTYDTYGDRYRSPYHTHSRRYDEDADDDRYRRQPSGYWGGRYYTPRRYYDNSGYGSPYRRDYGDDPYRYDTGSYRSDPFYGYDPYSASSSSFSWKRDWPLVLGTMIDAQFGR